MPFCTTNQKPRGQEGRQDGDERRLASFVQQTILILIRKQIGLKVYILLLGLILVWSAKLETLGTAGNFCGRSGQEIFKK